MQHSDADRPSSPSSLVPGRGSAVLSGQAAAALGDALAGRLAANAPDPSAFAADPAQSAVVPTTAPGGKPRLMRLLHRAALAAKPYLEPALRRVEARIGTAVNRSDSMQRLQNEVASLRAGQARSMASEAMAAKERSDALTAQLDARVGALEGELVRLRGDTEALLQRFAFPIGEGLLATRNRYGYLVLPTSDPANVGYLVEGVLPEQGSLAIMEKLIGPGDVVVDLGANVGLFTLAAARAVGAGGHVHALEPAPDLVGALRVLAKLNQIAGVVTIHPVAAGAQEGSAELFLASTSGHNSLFAEDSGLPSTKVRVAPLDALIAPGTAVSFVKMDVEGAELQALAGMKRVIADNPGLAILAEFSPGIIRRSGGTPLGWIDAVRAMGLKILEIDEAACALKPLRAQGLEEAAWINLVLHGPQADARLAPLFVEGGAA